MARGEAKTVTLVAEPHVGGVKVRAEDTATGDAVAASVWIDGAHVGTTPYRNPAVWLCSKEVAVVRGDDRQVLAVEVKEGEWRDERVRFVGGGKVVAVAVAVLEPQPEIAGRVPTCTVAN